MDDMLNNVRSVFGLMKRTLKYGRGRGKMFALIMGCLVSFGVYCNVVLNSDRLGMMTSIGLVVLGLLLTVVIGSNISYVKDRLDVNELKLKLLAFWVLGTFAASLVIGIALIVKLEVFVTIPVIIYSMVVDTLNQNAKYNRTRLYRVK